MQVLHCLRGWKKIYTNRPFSVMCFTSTPHLRVVIHNMQSTYSTETIQHKLYVCVIPTSTCFPLFPPHYQYLDQPYHFEKMASPSPPQPNQPLKSHQHTPFPPKAKYGGRELSTCQTQNPMTRITGDTVRTYTSKISLETASVVPEWRI